MNKQQLSFTPVELRISDKELRAPGALGIDVEIIEHEEIEEIDYSDIEVDRRLTFISPYTRFVISHLL